MWKWIAFVLFLIPAFNTDACPVFPINVSVDRDWIKLCNRDYILYFDNRINSAILSIEVVNPDSNTALVRTSFKEDIRIPSRLKSFDNTPGFDRGHIVPAINANDVVSMQETMLSSNLVLQNERLNRGQWRRLELEIKRLALARELRIHVVNYIQYSDAYLNGIAIPKQFNKRVYINGVLVHCFSAKNDFSNLVEKKRCHN